MWEFICQHEIHRRTYKRASQPTVLDGIVAPLTVMKPLNNYDTVILLIFFEAVKYIK